MDTVTRTFDAATSGPWELPEGWRWVRLGAVGELIRGVSFTKDKASEVRRAGYVPLLRGNNIQNGAVDNANLICVDGQCVSNDQILRMRDIVLTMSSGSAALIGKSAWIGPQSCGMTFGAFCASLRVNEERALSRLIFWLFQTSYYRARISNSAKGTNINNLKREHLEGLPVPLAPIAEQRRIVARVDELFAEIAGGEAALAESRKGLDVFRRALLKAAVTGELTRDWRTENPATETGHDLLARIAHGIGKSGPAGRTRRTTSHPLDTTTLPPLPEHWAWATLGEIGDIVGGITVDKKRKPSVPVTVPYLRVANVQRGHIDLSEVKTITVEHDAVEKLRLLPGDLLLNEGGDRDKIGRGWVWDGSISDMIHQNHVFRVRLRDKALNPFFVSHYANELGRRFFIEQGKQTTNLASISLSKISTLPVPVPPPSEAVEILRRVSDALAAADDALAMLDTEAADAAGLKQSILKAAFEGRLVHQDPADEPASGLLARLATHEPAPRTGRGRARKQTA